MSDKTYDLIKKLLPYFGLLGAILVYAGGYWELPNIDKLGAFISGVVAIIMEFLNKISKNYFADKNIVPKSNDTDTTESGGQG